MRIVSSGPISERKPRLATFSQLSSSSLVTSTTSQVLEADADQDLGFFFDSTPTTIDSLPTKPKIAITEIPTISKSSYERKKQNIIQDDDIYISSDDDRIDDDQDSISSSEDMEMLQALSHWGKNDIMQFDEPASRQRDSHDDMYHVLNGISLDDITIMSDESEEEELEDDFSEEELSFDSLENVPESLKKNYRGVIREEKKRIKKKAASNQRLKERLKQSTKNQRKNSKQRKIDNAKTLDQYVMFFMVLCKVLMCIL